MAMANARIITAAIAANTAVVLVVSMVHLVASLGSILMVLGGGAAVAASRWFGALLAMLVG